MRSIQGDGDVNRTYWGYILLVLATVLLLFSFFCPLAKADPPDPRTHYKWEAWPNGTVVLHFRKDGFESRYLYQLMVGPRAANGCMNRYYPTYFELITFDQSHPAWYTMHTKPIMRWDAKKEEYVKLTGE